MDWNSNDLPLQLWHVTRSVVLHLWTHHSISNLTQSVYTYSALLGLFGVTLLMHLITHNACFYCDGNKHVWNRNRCGGFSINVGIIIIIIINKNSLNWSIVLCHNVLLLRLSYVMYIFLFYSIFKMFCCLREQTKLQTRSLVEPLIFQQHVVLILEFLLTKHLGHRLNVGQAAVREKKTNQLWGFAFNNV